jgi:hypothetical protein
MKKTRQLFFLLLPAFLGVACQSAEGKNWSDLLQILLQQSGWVGWLVCVGLVLALAQVFKLVGAAWRSSWWLYRQVKRLLIRVRWWSLLLAALFGTILWAMSGVLVEGLQEMEQRYWHPVYVRQYETMSEAHLTALYEAELARHTDPYECEVIKRRTREMAQKVASTPLAIYECAWLECGLKPFTIRRDQVAAGWIQFTRVGLGGLKYRDQPVRFEQVLDACRRRDVEFVMDLSEAYLVDKYQRAGARPLNNTIDLYLALFAPALIGAPHDKVVYAGWNNPSYYLNAGLDGWYVAESTGDQKQIFRKKSRCDGRITIYEMYLALEAKKNRLIQQRTIQ